ncbi:hypothetical protein [Serratia inhibens]|uniref:hypothetical protein n=1 Tax=Serratia inhibens TaxID=2338073 RepID=UPI00321730A4
MAGFLLFGVWTRHRTNSIIRPEGLTLRANAEALFNPAQAPVVRVRSPYLEEPAYGGFFAFRGMDSPSNEFDYSAEGLTLRANAEARTYPVDAQI